MGEVLLLMEVPASYFPEEIKETSRSSERAFWYPFLVGIERTIGTRINLLYEYNDNRSIFVCCLSESAESKKEQVNKKSVCLQPME